MAWFKNKKAQGSERINEGDSGDEVGDSGFQSMQYSGGRSKHFELHSQWNGRLAGGFWTEEWCDPKYVLKEPLSLLSEEHSAGRQRLRAGRLLQWVKDDGNGGDEKWLMRSSAQCGFSPRCLTKSFLLNSQKNLDPEPKG